MSALARIRTGMPCGAAPSRQCVYQFHHQGGSRKLGLRPAGIKQDLASGASRDTLHAMELWVAFAFGAAVGGFVGVLIGRYQAAARRSEATARGGGGGAAPAPVPLPPGQHVVLDEGSAKVLKPLENPLPAIGAP